MVQQPTDSQYGSEFTYTFWMFINDTNFSSLSTGAKCDSGSGQPLLKHVFHKGSNDFYSNDNNYHYPILQSPGVWIYPNTNKLGINFNTYNNIVETCDIGNIPLNINHKYKTTTLSKKRKEKEQTTRTNKINKLHAMEMNIRLNEQKIKEYQTKMKVLELESGRTKRSRI